MLPIGIDLRRFGAPSEKGASRSSLCLPRDRRVVLFVGNLLKAKGVHELLAALEILKNENIVGVFVGDGPLRSAVQGCPNAIWAGVRPNAELVSYYGTADVLVLPSYHEGLPTVLVEAGATGLPVIASAVGGIPELLGNCRGTIIPSRDISAIATSIRAILNDNIRADGMASAFKDYINQNYDAHKTSHTLLNIYRHLSCKI